MGSVQAVSPVMDSGKNLLDGFFDKARKVVSGEREPWSCVEELFPDYCNLLAQADSFLDRSRLRTHPDHYARNALHVSEDGLLSLYALVWQPGQWTPVHDHGTWGLVGVVDGVLEERNFIRVDTSPDNDTGRNTGIELVRGGLIRMVPGTVTSFVPNPDHIHKTGTPEGAERVVSLHLYGRDMCNFHIYDVEAGTRRLIDVESC